MSHKKAQATFELKPGTELQPGVLRKTVADAGFTPRGIFITVRGKLSDKGGKMAFQPAGSTQLFSLAENAALAKLKTERVTEAGLIAKVIGDRPSLSLEIQEYHK